MQSDNLHQFEKTGDLSYLLEQTSSGSLYPWYVHERLDDAYDHHSCYKFAIAHVLEKDFPGVVSYLQSQNKGKSRGNPHYFLRILGEFEKSLRQKHHQTYAQLSLTGDTFIPGIERLLENQTVYLSNGTHAEAYELRQVGAQVAVYRVGWQNGEMQYWVKGNFTKWIQSNRRIDATTINFDILRTDILSDFDFWSSTQVSTRLDFIEMFQDVDLRLVTK